MKQLVPGLYEGTGHAANLFGLSNGNLRDDDFVHNGRWFNRDCEYLGWGDLSQQDLCRIRDEISEDELFVVLYESEGLRGRNMPADEVMDRARFVVVRNQLYLVARYDEKPGTDVQWRGLAFQVISKDAIPDLLKR